MSETHLRETIVEVGRRLYARGYTASNDGNISVRLDEARLITTPKNVSKGFMTPDMMVITDLEGKKISGQRDPSSELKMHLLRPPPSLLSLRPRRKILSSIILQKRYRKLS